MIIIAKVTMSGGIWFDRARATLDQGRFAGAVFTHEGMGFSFNKLDADII
tara:strand:+ start:652 stop:801 length:150 start_codon:yes stop_codon:yes gene_type:complete